MKLTRHYGRLGGLKMINGMISLTTASNNWLEPFNPGRTLNYSVLVMNNCQLPVLIMML